MSPRDFDPSPGRSPERWRLPGGLRFRFAALLIGGVLAVSLALYALLVTVTEVWVRQEMQTRTRSFATLIAARVALPLLVEDRGGIREELLRATREPDVLGVAVYRDSATRIADASVIPDLWREPSQWTPRGPAPIRSGWGEPRAAGERVLDVRVPVLREVPRDSSAFAETRALLDDNASAAPAEGDAAALGWVRVVVSTARLEAAVASVARMGLLVLLALVALVTLPLMFLLRVLVQPLREASGLARQIAAGHLDQRLPVRSRDELGTLAESLNSMAGALADARAHARAEESTLRTATEAMLAIARSARHSADPAVLFGTLAPELRRHTRCEAVALAHAQEAHGAARFALLEPAGAWGEVHPGMPLDPLMSRWLSGAPSGALRRELDAEAGPVERVLHAKGYRTVLVVALGLEASPAALVMVARRADAFPADELDMITALASHLSSALDASGLRDSLERAFDELQSARGQLFRSERLRVAGEMASGVAHDFNNVLGAILGRAQLLKRRAQRSDLTPDELMRSLDVIERAAHDGGDTVARLRQFGQAQDAATPERVDLDAALREAAEFTRTRWENEAQAEGRRIEIHIDSSPGAWVTGRSHEMREVFTNLILNAVDALPRGGEIRLHASVENGRATAWVEDNGVGMSLDVQRRVFDPFFTTKGESGTGLGLSVVYGIVQRQGGDIALYSEPSIGTRAELSFPLAAPLPVPEAGPILPMVVTLPELALDVMVVDDETAVRDLLADVVQTLGHRVIACDSGERALQMFVPGGYDLLLTDLGMPGITGWQLARRVREQDPIVTIAFITGWGHELSPDVVRESGANALVAKPFHIEDIEGLIRLASENRPDRRVA